MIGALRRSIQRLRRPLPMAELAAEDFYEDYWRERLEREPDITTTAPARAAIVAEFVEPGWSLLDLGCGDGSFLACLRALVPDLRLEGADVSEQALDVCRGRGFDTTQIDLAQPGIQLSGEHDVVTLLEVIEHVPDAESLVLAAARHARRHVIVSVPNYGFIENRVRLLAGRAPLDNVVHHVREHLRHWTRTDFREWAGALGLEIIAERPTRPVGAAGLGRRWPSVFSSGLLYVLRSGSSAGGGASTSSRL